MSLSRRAFLSSATAMAVGSSIVRGKETGDSHEFTITGVKDVTVRWHDGSKFLPGVAAGAFLGGDTIALNKDLSVYVDNKLILHELGHCLGYTHDTEGDCEGCGVMDYDHPDAQCENPLSPVTKEIAASFDGYRVFETETSDLLDLIERWRTGDVGTQQLLYAIRQWAMEDGKDQILYTSSWDGFGGYFEEKEYTTGLPQHQYDGYFYGLPTVGCSEQFRIDTDWCNATDNSE